MSNEEIHESALKAIEGNIDSQGQHVYAVGVGPTPKYCYTIGLHQSALGAEVVIAGAAQFTIYELTDVLNELGEVARAGGLDPSAVRTASHVGEVRFAAVHESWVQRLLLGARDYYSPDHVAAYQVLFRPEFVTIDTPDLSREWDPETEPVWRWLELPWVYPFPETTTVVTNLRALRGDHITEVCHWEDDEWELVAAVDTPITTADLRVVSFGTLLAVDPSLEAVLSLPRGKALHREGRSYPWEPWGT